VTGHHDELHHDHGHQGGVRGFVHSVIKPHSHDVADSVDSALEASQDGIRALWISLLGLGLTAFAQFGVVVVTGSVALLSDSVHNLSDALTALPLWVAFMLARRPATRRFPWGYGRAEDLSGLLILAAIAASALFAGWQSIDRLLHPQPLHYLGAVLAAGIVGFAGNEAVAAYRIRVGRRIGSAALVADGMHARTDGFTSLGVAAGALGVIAGFPLADPIVGLLITVAILVVLRGAARQVFRRLMDGVEPELVDRAERTLAAVPGVLEVESVRLRWLGHRLRAEVGLVVDHTLTVWDGHEIAVEAEHQLLHHLGKLDEATVHISPDARNGLDPHHALAHHRHLTADG
jgi:cation diffusion facilitator family transporter